jgi:GDP-4-dehydro-6-deoxy-D-mannose reductase
LSLLSDRGRRGHVYHVCAGRSWRIGELLDSMLEAFGRKVPIVSDPGRSRPGDLEDIYGDPTRLHQATGWKPEIPVQQSLADVLASAGLARRAA